MTFKKKFPNETIFSHLSTTEPKSTKEISLLAGCALNTAKKALFELEKEGKAKSKMFDGKYYVWWKVE